MAASADIALMAHLMRRAGFSARRAELEHYLDLGYEAMVERLLTPLENDGVDQDIVDRYYIDIDDSRNSDATNAGWLYRIMVQDQLREMADPTPLVCSLTKKVAVSRP